VRITTFVTEYVLPLLACPCCGKINAAQAPPWAHAQWRDEGYRQVTWAARWLRPGGQRA
jgi:hypothetical protein